MRWTWVDFLRDATARAWDDYTQWRFVRSIAAPGTIHRGAIVLKDPWCELTLGEGACVEQGAILYCRNAVPHATGENARLRIGARSFVGHYCNLRTAGGDIDIGEDVLLGQFVSLIAAGHGTQAGSLVRDQPVPARRGIRIGHGAWLGAGVVVLPGVAVGEGAIVGAGAVVTHDVPAGVIAAGNPARVIRQREDME